MNRPNLPLPDNKAARSKIVRDKNVNARNGNVNNARREKKVANPEAVSRADDKASFFRLTSGGKRVPPLLFPKWQKE